MPVDPESLLIFKEREEEQKAKKGAQKKSPKEVAAESEKAGAEKAEAKAAVQEQAQQQQAKARVPEEEVYTQQMQQRQKVVQKKREEQGVYVAPTITTKELETAVRIAGEGFKAEEIIPSATKRQTKREKLSRQAARGLYCSWHPWRPAYAICDYCHRPFCFEDLVEYGRAYYCLEDIDRVVNYSQETYLRYNKLSFVSSTLFLVIFAIFAYYANGQIFYLANLINSVGIKSFFTNLNYSYAVSLVEMLLIALSLITGLMLFIQARAGFGIGLLAGFGTVAVFSYEYLNTSALYLALISSVGFGALLTLAYSRVSYEPIEETPYSSINAQAVNWPNVGRF